MDTDKKDCCLSQSKTYQCLLKTYGGKEQFTCAYIIAYLGIYVNYLAPTSWHNTNIQ